MPKHLPILDSTKPTVCSMRILIAFDKFKDSLAADSASSLAASVVREIWPQAELLEIPLTDGGEGFSEILTRARQGHRTRHRVSGPRFAPVEAMIGWVEASRSLLSLHKSRAWPERGVIAVIEMAQASGLARLPPAERNCWETSSFGTGQLLRLAADQGASAILLGIGGSATCDLGAGALEALGLEFYDRYNRRLEHIVPALFPQVHSIRSRLSACPAILIACDVQNPLLGPRGTAAVYGPQKGLPQVDVPRMDEILSGLADLLCDTFARPRRLQQQPCAGAAGGIGFGLQVALSAQFVPGFDLVWEWLQLETHLRDCDWLITGEGRFDRSSLEGKGPGRLMQKAVALGKPVLVLAGSVEKGLALPDGVEVRAITPEVMPLPEALVRTPELLQKALRYATIPWIG